MQTVELVFGTKRELLKNVVDIATAGDDEPIPVSERDWIRWAQATSQAPAGRGFPRPAVATVNDANMDILSVREQPRGPAGTAVRRYMLAGLVACGRCGRRLESAWSDGKPAYRCRHGYTSATRPDSGRAKNTYVREDQILPHLPVLAILFAVPAGTPAHGNSGLAQVTGPADTAVLIDQLRANGVVLTYDADGRTLRASDHDAPSVIISKDR